MSVKAIYGWSISSAPAIWSFYVPAGFICYIVACLRCLWATAEIQDSWLRGTSFQMGNFCFLPGTHHLNSFFGYGIMWSRFTAACRSLVAIARTWAHRCNHHASAVVPHPHTPTGTAGELACRPRCPRPSVCAARAYLCSTAPPRPLAVASGRHPPRALALRRRRRSRASRQCVLGHRHR